MEPIKPQAGPQSRFVASGVQFVIFGGQAGGGKSYGLILIALGLCLRHPDFKVLTLRKLLKSGVLSVWDEMVDMCATWPAVKQISRSRYRIIFHNGSSIQMGHLQKPDEFRKWQGGQFDAVLFDELAEGFKEREFSFLSFSRLRGKSGGPKLIRATCNPSSDSFVRKYVAPWCLRAHPLYPYPDSQPLWFVRQRPDDQIVFYVDRAEVPADQHPMSIVFMRSELQDNPKLLEVNPGYAATLEALPYVDYRQQAMGDWEVSERESTVLNREWIKLLARADLPTDEAPIRVLAWDTAGRIADHRAKAGEDVGNYTVALLVHYYPQRELFAVVEILRVRVHVGELPQLIVQRAREVGPEVHIALEQEPGSQAAAMLSTLVRTELPTYPVTIFKPATDKVTRTHALSSLAHRGQVAIVDGPHRDTVLDEWHAFPMGAHDDTVDAATLALHTARAVQPAPRDPGLWAPRVRHITL